MILSAVCVRQDTFINTKERAIMTNLEIFAKRVRDTREAIPATLEEIALFSGLTPERVATIESGKDKSVNALEINRLAFALGTTYQDLMFRRG